MYSKVLTLYSSKASACACVGGTRWTTGDRRQDQLSKVAFLAGSALSCPWMETDRGPVVPLVDEMIIVPGKVQKITLGP